MLLLIIGILCLLGLLIYIFSRQIIAYFNRISLKKTKRFAANAAHELRTPLAAIKTQAQIALISQNLAEKDQAIEKLLLSVNRCTHIIQQLLIQGNLSPEKNFSLVQLDSIAQDIYQLLLPIAHSKNIQILCQFEEKLPAIIGNEVTLGILIRNLLDNAIRYSPMNSQINLKLYSRKKEIVLEIIDQGPGIPKSYQRSVFERFYRILGNENTGCGLGLSIVQEISLQHHARIILKSNPAKYKGLSIKLYFPKATHKNKLNTKK